MRTGRVERLDYAERWLRDGMRVVEPAGGIFAVEVDMSNALALKGRMKEAGTPVTYTHMIVHAAARTLAGHPELHRLVAGNTKLFPESVDICLSVAGEGAVTPVIIIENAGNKSLAEIAANVRECTPEAQRQDLRLHEILRTWGWIAPFGILRRALLRFLLARVRYRRQVSGTFQVSIVSSVDLAAPFLFNTAGVLGAGRVRERTVPVEGRIEIRPVLLLTCCIDHKVWNGLEAANFLNFIKMRLEGLSEMPVE